LLVRLTLHDSHQDAGGLRVESMNHRRGAELPERVGKHQSRDPFFQIELPLIPYPDGFKDIQG
jgi:hypothetical protein